MRTTLELDDSLLEALMTRNPGVSKTEAIEAAVREYLRSDAASRLRQLAGTVEIDDAAAELRAIDRRL